MQTFISHAKVLLNLDFTVKHLLREELMIPTQMQKHTFKPNEAYNEAKSMQLKPSKFLCIATVDVWHGPALQHS